ncbi:tRNA (N6-isopentenyl adenosine(37)-C2)-methylthiotransferase MiaB [Bacteroidia bacterium]|nr:tRNA (N6-isopentenyl adenosine(37)-C2)-methylthiotransferase MiaB [Bacteroidia bacterium]
MSTLTEEAKHTRKLHIESYGCAMNFADSEIIASIMGEHGFSQAENEIEADVIFLNTCAIRDNAEQRIRERLRQLRSNKSKKSDLIIGVLGCMAERLKDKLLEEEKLVDVVAGPDSYRELPKLVAEVDDGTRAINVLLSREETYGDLNPVRLNTNGVTAYISIMRGCDNMCTFCVVPFTRGRERSRDPESIINEAKDLQKEGYKEITLLGQNVDSYLWFGGGPKKEFKKLTPEQQESSVDFADLLEKVALAVPNMRIRYSTSHPRDITEKVVHTMAKYKNVCNYIHLPAQSGNSRVLDIMSRNYSREWYMSKIEMIRNIIPDCGISCDIIAGFCTETEEEHQDTLTLMEWSKFDFSYMYTYSERPGTPAAKKFEDDVPEEVKKRRLQEIIAVQHKISHQKNQDRVGMVCEVLIEGNSKKSDQDWMGRNDTNNVVVFPKGNYKIGDLVKVKITRSTTTTLIGEAIGIASL